MNKIIETERLYLREFIIDDAQLLVGLNSDIAVTRFTGDAPIELEESKKIISEIILPQYIHKMGRWAVHLKENNEFIGWCGIKYIDSLNEYDLGYRFFQKHWKKGYATESAKAVVNYGINTLKLKSIVGRSAINNHSSIKVLEKIGFKFLNEDFEHGERINKYILEVL